MSAVDLDGRAARMVKRSRRSEHQLPSRPPPQHLRRRTTGSSRMSPPIKARQYSNSTNSDSDDDSDDENQDGASSSPAPSNNVLAWKTSTTGAIGACNDITVSWAGGVAPFRLVASQTDLDAAPGPQEYESFDIADSVFDNFYTWTISSPVNTTVTIQLYDDAGGSISSQNPLIVVTNQKGQYADEWCKVAKYAAASPTGPQATATATATAETGGNSNGDGDGGDSGSYGTSSAFDSAAASRTPLVSSSSSSSLSATSTAALVTVYPSSANDTVPITQDDFAALLKSAKTAEGVLSALLAIALLASVALYMLHSRLQRQHRRLVVENSNLREAAPPGGTVYSEKGAATTSHSGAGMPGRAVLSQHDLAYALHTTNRPQSSHSLISLASATPSQSQSQLGDHRQSSRRDSDNPFLDSASSAEGLQTPRSVSEAANGRLSFVSNATSRVTGVSAVSNEYYSRTKASTIPLKSNDGTYMTGASSSSSHTMNGLGLGGGGGFGRLLTPSIAPSSASRSPPATPSSSGEAGRPGIKSHWSETSQSQDDDGRTLSLASTRETLYTSPDNGNEANDRTERLSTGAQSETGSVKQGHQWTDGLFKGW